MIAWQPPGPYRVAFTTRSGGVSAGAFASLNLGSRGDDPAAIEENRQARLRRRSGSTRRSSRSTASVHGATVNRARAGGRGEEGDGLWTDAPELPLLALAADCVPIAIVATQGRPALAVVHAGWRGLASGVVEAAVAALGARRSAAMVGPSIGPCCYEVGEEVSARFDADLTRAGVLDLWEAAARALARAGVEAVERAELCTRCNPELFFSHRASGSDLHGAQGVDRCSRALRSPRATGASASEVGAGVTVVAATKYVAARRHGCAFRGRRGGRGREPRAGPRSQARRLRLDAFAGTSSAACSRTR